MSSAVEGCDVVLLEAVLLFAVEGCDVVCGGRL